MKVQVRIALADESGTEFCGPGLLELLDGVQRLGSIQQAAREMKLSYVKALKVLNRLEKALGEPLLIRHKGGAERGHSSLTPFARLFMRDFAALRKEVQRNTQRASKSFVKQYEGKRA